MKIVLGLLGISIIISAYSVLPSFEVGNFIFQYLVEPACFGYTLSKIVDKITED